MKCLAFVAVVLASFAFPTHSVAQTKTGNDLLNECQVVTESNSDEAALLKGVQCVSYLRGMSQTFNIWQAFNESRKQANPAPVCVPNGVSGREMAMVVVKYIKDHPTTMHSPYSAVAFHALADSYPCK